MSTRKLLRLKMGKYHIKSNAVDSAESGNCCCIHLLSISKVVEAVDAPFQSYDGFCP